MTQISYAPVVLMVAATLAVACGDAPTAETEDARPTSLSLSARAIEIFRIEPRSPAATVRDAAGNVLSVSVAWSSSDTSVAQVNATGTVTGVAPGTATIEARVDNLTATTVVTVLERMDFTFPLLGALNQDFYYLNYVDQEPGAGIRDYQCGPKTNGGHLGTDLTLPSFARMDSGVAVLATALGTVSTVHDGEPDRNKSPNPGGSSGTTWSLPTETGSRVSTVTWHDSRSRCRLGTRSVPVRNSASSVARATRTCRTCTSSSSAIAWW